MLMHAALHCFYDNASAQDVPETICRQIVIHDLHVETFTMNEFTSCLIVQVADEPEGNKSSE